MSIASKFALNAPCCAIALSFALSAALPAARAAATGSDVMRWTATGVQIYACKRDGERFAWSFERPEATLANDNGQVEAQHGAGPSWTAGDGSVVYGTMLTAVPAPVDGGIPWLVLRASRHDGGGMMSDVAYILRTHTDGGMAPLTGCDAAHDGAEARIPYHALYTFLVEARPASR